MNNVYLVPHEDGTYEACIAPVAPSKNAALLTAEGEYPVECFYRRMDANGDGIIEMYRCSTQEELIEALNYDGKALHTIRTLWDFNSNNGVSEAVCTVFNAAIDAWVVLSAEDEDYFRGVPIGIPTVKEFISILSEFPEDYRVTCCGAKGFIHLFEENKYITIDTEHYLT